MHLNEEKVNNDILLLIAFKTICMKEPIWILNLAAIKIIPKYPVTEIFHLLKVKLEEGHYA